jgi:hypothetical protein
MADKEEGLADRIARALDSDVPKVYFNGYVNHLSTSDILTVLERSGRPVAVLNMSYTVAKSLCASLGQLIAQLEAATERTMLTTSDVETSMRKLVEGGQKQEKK